jgi:outer membrane cobalamin receptor
MANDKIMKEQLVSLEIAKLAKEKGFNWKCNAFYGKYNDDVSKLIDDDNYSKESYQLLQKRDHGIYAIQVKDWNSNTIWCDYDVFCPVKYSASTQSLLKKYLRDKHNIHVEVRLCGSLYKKLYEKSFDKECKKYWCNIITSTGEEFTVGENFTSDSFEEIFEKGLFEALKFVKI